jgi:hypothetical protein
VSLLAAAPAIAQDLLRAALVHVHDLAESDLVMLMQHALMGLAKHQAYARPLKELAAATAEERKQQQPRAKKGKKLRQAARAAAMDLAGDDDEQEEQEALDEQDEKDDAAPLEGEALQLEQIMCVRLVFVRLLVVVPLVHLLLCSFVAGTWWCRRPRATPSCTTLCAPCPRRKCW